MSENKAEELLLSLTINNFKRIIYEKVSAIPLGSKFDIDGVSFTFDLYKDLVLIEYNGKELIVENVRYPISPNVNKIDVSINNIRLEDEELEQIRDRPLLHLLNGVSRKSAR